MISYVKYNRTVLDACVSAQSPSCVWLRNPMACSLPGSSVHGNFQARILEWLTENNKIMWNNYPSMKKNNLKKNTGVDRHFLLQGIFPTQESNLWLLHWQADSLPLSHLRSSHEAIMWVLYNYKSVTPESQTHKNRRKWSIYLKGFFYIDLIIKKSIMNLAFIRN